MSALQTAKWLNKIIRQTGRDSKDINYELIQITIKYNFVL